MSQRLVRGEARIGGVARGEWRTSLGREGRGSTFVPTMVEDEAFVSLAVNDTNATAALVLGDSLRDTNTGRKLALLISSNVSQLMRDRLNQVWDDVILLDELQPGYVATPSIVDRPELGLVFFKLKIWTLTQFKKCVFLDADTLVLGNIDELFGREELSAAPDTGWPDCFNSGVLVFVPSLDTYQALVGFADEHGSFDGTDQGLLNMFFKDWASTRDRQLPYVYNMVASTCYTYTPAVNHYGKNVKVVRYAGSTKPWLRGYRHSQSRADTPPSSQGDGPKQSFMDMWWDRYHKMHPETSGMQGQLPDQPEKQDEPPVFYEGPKVEPISEQQRAWERGDIDFTRKDRFDVIQHYIDNTIEGIPNVESQQDYVESYDEPSYNEEKQNFSDDYEVQVETPQENQVSLRYHLDFNSVEYFDSGGSSPPLGHETQGENQELGNVSVVNEGPNETLETKEVREEEVLGELDPDEVARLRWEFGRIDFTGEDSFDNIEMYLNSILQKMEQSLDAANSAKPRKFDDRGASNDETDRGSSNDSKLSRESSPVPSLTDSAYFEPAAQRPEMISRATQTSFNCISKSVQTEIDFEFDSSDAQ